MKTKALIPSYFLVGPFISVVLSKLENMLENSLHVNLLLIGIITQLASYPQPLLRSFLLNTNMVFQPSVRSLYQVFTTGVSHAYWSSVFSVFLNLTLAPFSFTCTCLRASYFISLFHLHLCKELETRYDHSFCQNSILMQVEKA